MDLVIVLDASGSDRRHWRKILLFVAKFIRFIKVVCFTNYFQQFID